MNAIDVLKLEHLEIERELFEFDSIMTDDVINYPNLLHVFLRFCEIWDPHELKEEKIFGVMKRERIRVPVYTMTCEHRDLRGHMKRIREAIGSGSDYKIKKSFKDDLSVVLDKVRKHMTKEDQILYTIALDEFSEEELREMGREIERFAVESRTSVGGL